MTSAPETWHSAAPLRTIAWVVVVTYPVAFVAVVVSQFAMQGGEPTAAFLTMLLFAPLTVGSWLYFLRPWIHADARELTVRNPLAIYRVPYHDVISCSPGYAGLTIVTRRGVVLATSVQKSNIATWLHRETRVVRVAALIEQRAQESPG